VRKLGKKNQQTGQNQQ